MERGRNELLAVRGGHSRFSTIVLAVLFVIGCEVTTESPHFQLAIEENIVVNGDLEVGVGIRVIEVRGRLGLPCMPYALDGDGTIGSRDIRLTMRGRFGANCAAGAAVERRYRASFTGLPPNVYALTVIYDLEGSTQAVVLDTTVTVP